MKKREELSQVFSYFNIHRTGGSVTGPFARAEKNRWRCLESLHGRGGGEEEDENKNGNNVDSSFEQYAGALFEGSAASAIGAEFKKNFGGERGGGVWKYEKPTGGRITRNAKTSFVYYGIECV